MDADADAVLERREKSVEQRQARESVIIEESFNTVLDRCAVESFDERAHQRRQRTTLEHSPIRFWGEGKIKTMGESERFNDQQCLKGVPRRRWRLFLMSPVSCKVDFNPRG